MMNLSIFPDGRFLKTRLGVIFILSGLLIFYHVSKVYDLYWGVEIGDHTALIDTQSFIRLVIAASLSLVVLGVRGAPWRRWALLGMWVSITSLVITRYMLIWNAPVPGEIENAFPLS
jgi:glucan phosphoethanolaminetransferase (alkaline phosphatase superfamily)